VSGILQSRTWDSGFFSPAIQALPADSTIERVLSSGEVKALLDALGIKLRRPRWKLW